VIVEVTHLHQPGLGELRPARRPAEPATLVHLDEPAPEFARFLYTAVGRRHFWSSRLDWTTAQWLARVRDPRCAYWILWLRGAPVGYTELSATPTVTGTTVTIDYLGLLPRYIGRGFGGQLLTESVGLAWTAHERVDGLRPVDRVQVKTTSLDGAYALPNYEARGFTIEQVVRRHAYLVDDRLVWSSR
jgi:GNAT superfamily N-acetyltransferase